MEHSHARDVARKNGILQAQILELESAEQQFGIARKAHLRALDRLVDEQDGRLVRLEEAFTKQVAELRAVFQTEREDLTRQSEAELKELRHTAKVLEERQLEQQLELKDIFDGHKTELQNDAMGRIHTLQNSMDGLIDSLSSQFDEAHSAYIQVTDGNGKMKSYKELRKKSSEEASLVERLRNARDSKMRATQRMRRKLAKMTGFQEARIASMAKRKADMIADERELKAALKASRLRQARRLRCLTNTGIAATAKLAGLATLAEHILVLNENCRELESHTEKVDPFHVRQRTGMRVSHHEQNAVEGPPSSGVAIAMPDHDLNDDTDQSVLAADADHTRAMTLAGLDRTDSGHVQLHQAHKEQLTAACSAATEMGSSFGVGTAVTRHEGRVVEGDEGQVNVSRADIAFRSEMSQAAGQGSALHPHATGSGGESVDPFRALHNFHRRANKASIDRHALKQERNRLAGENAKLHTLLKTFLEGISVTDATLATRNTLVLVNDSSLCEAASQGSAPRAAAIDGVAHFRSTISAASRLHSRI